MQFGSRLRDFREHRHLGQRQLAKLSIESDKNSNPGIDTVSKLADALGVSIDDLIGRSPVGRTIPQTLHDAAIQSGLSYEEAWSFTGFFDVATSLEDWNIIIIIYRTHPDWFELLKKIPDNLTVMKDMLKEPDVRHSV